MEDPVRQVIDGRYALERELGRGGMATVWLARDLRHERQVAVKIVHPELAGAIGVDRFVREVGLTARLVHPNIVPILDSGTLPADDGGSLPWFAMPYLEGESLRARLAREQQLPVEEALRITEAVAEALQAAHRQGIVHRDIKPDNILLASDRVYVVDFGIAKALLDTGVDQLTSTGMAIGTPAYMSPEQATASPVDARSDQYSLASVLYEMLAGEPPFSGPTAQSLMARRMTEPPRPIRTVRPAVPGSVERAVLRALDRVPADRFPDVGGFVAALRDRSEAPTHGRPARPGARVLALIGGLVVVAMVAGWQLFGPRQRLAGHDVDPEVRALYDRGVRGYDRRTSEGVVDAIGAFSAAIRLDSGYTPAWAGLAQAYSRAYERGFDIPGLGRDSVIQRAVAAVDRALADDPRNAAAWLTRAIVVQQVDPTDLGPSLRAVRRALALDSASAPAWHTLARDLAETGDLSAAVAAWQRSVALDPAYYQAVAFLGLGYYWRRDFRTAATWTDSAVALEPEYVLGRSSAGYVAIEQGDTAKAAAAFGAALRLSTGVEAVNSLAALALVAARAGRTAEARGLLHRVDSLAAVRVPIPLHTAVYLAQAHAALGDVSGAVAWLGRFQPRRSLHFQLHLRCDPPLAPVAGDPRFQALLTIPRPPPGQGC